MCCFLAVQASKHNGHAGEGRRCGRRGRRGRRPGRQAPSLPVSAPPVHPALHLTMLASS